MKIEMDLNTSTAIQHTSWALAFLGMVFCITFFWFGTLIRSYNGEELAKHESCYIEYEYNEAHQVNVPVKEYCGNSTP